MRRSMTIGGKMMVGFFLFAFLPLLVLGLMLYQSGKSDILETTKSSLSSLNRITSNEIDTFVEHNLRSIVMIADMHRLSNLSDGINLKSDGKASNEIREILLGPMSLSGYFEELFLLHPQTGEVLVSTNPRMEGMFFGNRPYFGLGKERPSIYRVHYSLALEKNILALSAPTKKDGRLVGVIVGWLNIDELGNIATLASPARCYLVSRSNLHVVGMGGDIKKRPIRSGIFTNASQRALAGETGTGIYTDSEGVDVVGAYSPVKALDLALITELPLEEVYGNVSRLGFRILLITMVLAVLLLLMSVIAGRQIAGPIAHLTESVMAFSKGSGNNNIKATGGSAEVDRLAEAFGTMISRRKDVEDSLRESEERFRTLFDKATDCIHLLAPTPGGEPVIVDANEHSCKLHGYSRDELVGKPISFLDSPESRDDIQARTGNIMAGETLVFEVEHVRKDGSTIPLEVSAHMVRIGGKPYILSMERDITERKIAEERIRASLREKEALLKEIHHRVKNNMQIMSSLLRLQAGYARDERDADLFRNSLLRIKSMALLHERVYLSGNFSEVNCRKYLESLSGGIAYSLRPPEGNVSMKIDVADDMTIAIDTAIPCGLVINELIANAFLHAFPGGRSGEITVSMKRNQMDEIELVVRDNGVGIPEDVELKSSESMGLTLVEAIIVGQFHGKMELSRDGGTEFRIRFKEPEYPLRV